MHKAKIHDILLKHWGYSTFRPLQEDIIVSVLNGNDTLALLPTGGGKSICFQVPALASDGMCLVISPLIALMKDQVLNLHKKNIQAAAIVSGMHIKEIDYTLDNAVYGRYKFLYVSPERLLNELFIERFNRMQINLIAVDEAHCISQWGYDFRPPYLKIAELRKHKPEVPVLALTATATQEVVADIQNKLAFKKNNVFKKSFERKNLSYIVQKEENKLKRLLIICNKLKGSGVIYVRNRKRTQEVADFLIRNNIRADFYHAGLEMLQREKKQFNWINNQTRVIVSTNAFGMGIDKPDVRFVIHLDLPDSPEAYFQEAGRAGRDEKNAYAILLWNYSDVIDLKKNFENQFPEKEIIKKTYIALCNYFQIAVNAGTGVTFNFNLNDFCKRFNLNASITFNALKILELAEYIALSEAYHNPSKIKITVDNLTLYDYQLRNPKFDKFIKVLLRSYGGIFDNYVIIKEEDIALRMELSLSDTINSLNYLDRINIISYIPRNDNPQVTLLSPRVSESSFYLANEVYETRKKRAENRINTMINYAEQAVCRSNFLLNYFGEKTDMRCGVCDYCLKMNKTGLSNIDYQNIANDICNVLKQNALSLKDLLPLLQQHKEEKVIKVIQWMLDNEELKYNSQQQLIINH
jgi:ATP-dependent DNA helicase RecQ